MIQFQDLYRQYVVDVYRFSYWLCGNQSEAIELDTTQADTAPNPAAIVADRMQLQQVVNILQTLPEIERTAFVMRVQYELPYVEIARVLGLSLSAAKVKVHRTRLKLAILREDRESY